MEGLRNMNVGSLARLMCVCCLPVMLIACAGSPARQAVVSRDLPALPAYAVPVPPPAVRAGQDPKALAGAALVALDKANTRIVDLGQWYEGVRSDYARPGN